VWEDGACEAPSYLIGRKVGNVINWKQVMDGMGFRQPMGYNSVICPACDRMVGPFSLQ